jgi:ABC-2 type transport system ATP-binding protein
MIEQSDNFVIQTQGLTKIFDEEVAVKDLNFQVPHGKIFGLIGPSGCGKTTTVRLLLGVYQPTEGEALVLGSEPLTFTRDIRSRIGYMPQHFVLYPDLTVWENLNFVTSIYGVGLRRRDRLEEILDFVELGEHRHKTVHNISGGMKRRLSLAVTLVHDPELLFMDEPTGGIDPVLRRKFWDHFQALQEEGRTLLITTQYVGEAAYCDLVGMLIEGRLLVVDTPGGLRRRSFGGDVVDLQTTTHLDSRTLHQIEELDFVHEVTHLSRMGLRIVVDEASTAIPELIEWCRERSITVKSIQEYLPPFDDVFVRLVEQEREREEERVSREQKERELEQAQLQEEQE